ncbi:MAG: hypothetical protein BWK76_14745 [Desulfobulbaceae bacterium A2]|nr:MAG: hypothetical protein BWK76_14745 [Desulfobulbaceae bacterium A2]
MHIVIVGGGAIGTLCGVFLSRGGHEVSVVDTDPGIVEAIGQRGLGLLAREANSPDEVLFTPARAVTNPAAIKECDLILLTVKSANTLTAMRSVSHLVGASAPVLSLQTGLGNLELMEKVVGREHILGGFTFMAATAMASGIARHGGEGKTYIGELDGDDSERCRRIGALLTDCGIPCTVVQRVVGRLWCKVIVYSAINSLSSVLRVKNGQLLERMESIALMQRLLDEGQSVARAHAVDLVFANLYDVLFDACRRTGDNLSSMLQDILNNRSTEIAAQCGALAAFGKAAGVATPTQQTMYELITLIEGKASQT